MIQSYWRTLRLLSFLMHMFCMHYNVLDLPVKFARTTVFCGEGAQTFGGGLDPPPHQRVLWRVTSYTYLCLPVVCGTAPIELQGLRSMPWHKTLPDSSTFTSHFDYNRQKQPDNMATWCYFHFHNIISTMTRKYRSPSILRNFSILPEWHYDPLRHTGWPQK